MTIRTQPTTLLELFCEALLNFKVIFISMAGPDKDTSRYEWVNSI